MPWKVTANMNRAKLSAWGLPTLRKGSGANRRRWEELEGCDTKTFYTGIKL